MGLGFEVFVIEDACRGIGLPVPGGGSTVDAAKADLLARGVQFVTADSVLA